VPPLETRGIALLLLFEVGLVGGETGCFGGKHRPVTVLLVYAGMVGWLQNVYKTWWWWTVENQLLAAREL
jgi:hypothetical protein